MSDNQNNNAIAVFRIKPLYGGSSIIKYVGYLTDAERLGDEVIELDKILHENSEIYGNNAIPLKKTDNYDMVGRLYRSNINGSYIVFKSEYPVLYLTVEYYKSIVSGSLFQIHISTKMSDELKKNISDKIIEKRKNNIQKGKKTGGEYAIYKDLQFDGQWSISIECDAELKELWQEKMTELLKNEYGETINETNNNSVIENEMKWYHELFNSYPYKFITLSRAQDYLFKLLNSEKLNRLIKVALECRIINRRNQYGITDEIYEVPEKINNLDNIKKQMIDNDELITNFSDEE